MDARTLIEAPLDDLLAGARAVRAGSRPQLVTYSPKVFVPLTRLCRDVCHYCTFAAPPRRGERVYLTIDEVLAIARAGAAAGCREALFTLGDKPELRYQAAREELASLGCETTLEYLARAARAVLEETGLLPHLNPGVLTDADVRALRPVSASMGLMLETCSERLARRGGPHFGSPDKLPARRLATLEAAGAARVPFTTGILIGIGETREERLEALQAIAESHRRHGHVQEVIVQNFRAKPGTRMAAAPEPSLEEHLWTLAAARLLLPPEVHSRRRRTSPRTSPSCSTRASTTGAASRRSRSTTSTPRLRGRSSSACGRRRAAAASSSRRACRSTPGGSGPTLARRGGRSGRASSGTPTRSASRARTAGRPGDPVEVPFVPRGALPLDTRDELDEDAIVAPVRDARRGARARLRGGRRAAAGGLRRRRQLRRHPEHQVHERLLLPLRLLRLLEGQARRQPARAGVPRAARGDRPPRRRGMGARRHGGLPPGRHPPGLHRRLLPRSCGRSRRPCRGCTCTRSRRSRSGRARPRSASSSRLPARGSATRASARCRARPPRFSTTRCARVLCPDKVTTAQWLEVHAAAHAVGLRSNNTIMFGHVDGPRNWARHLLAVREQQRSSGGFTEFVPLPFVPMEAPIYLKGPRPPRAHVRRGAARARRRPARAAPVDQERAGLLGEARRARRRRGAAAPASTTSAGRS